MTKQNEVEGPLTLFFSFKQNNLSSAVCFSLVPAPASQFQMADLYMPPELVLGQPTFWFSYVCLKGRHS